MENGQSFVDYYKVLKVSPDCDGRILQLAFHYLAKMYHPDNAATADPDKLSQVIDAYNVLKDPGKRAAYDRTYPKNSGAADYPYLDGADLAVDEGAVLSDAEAHARILAHLYKRRRERASDAGVIGWLLQEMLGCSEEHFEFHIWYLKSKGFIEVTEQGTIAVTIQGVDHVISTSQMRESETLLIQQLTRPDN